jgi:hypothetical protein
MNTVNTISENDYKQFYKWWEFWRWTPPAKELLPYNGLGGLKITDENGIDICVGFLYETNSGIAWIEFIVSNPEIKNAEIRSQGRKELIRYLTLLAENKGFKVVFSSLANEQLINEFHENGYSVSKDKTKELTIKF